MFLSTKWKLGPGSLDYMLPFHYGWHFFFTPIRFFNSFQPILFAHRSSWSQLQQLPKQWLRDVMAVVVAEDRSAALCATRRSAGIPFFLQVHHISSHSLFLVHLMPQLLSLFCLLWLCTAEAYMSKLSWGMIIILELIVHT